MLRVVVIRCQALRSIVVPRKWLDPAATLNWPRSFCKSVDRAGSRNFDTLSFAQLGPKQVEDTLSSQLLSRCLFPRRASIPERQLNPPSTVGPGPGIPCEFQNHNRGFPYVKLAKAVLLSSTMYKQPHHPAALVDKFFPLAHWWLSVLGAAGLVVWWLAAQHSIRVESPPVRTNARSTWRCGASRFADGSPVFSPSRR